MHDGKPPPTIRTAFTLVELLVASTIALAVMAAIAVLLGLFSRTASSTQAMVDLMNRMRASQRQLREDLSGVTCRLVPPVTPETGSGYFELIEGPQTDSGKPWRPDISYVIGDRVAFNRVSWVAIQTGSNNQPNLSPAAWSLNTPLTADIDDILLLTTRKSEKPFAGKYTYSGDINIESSDAELAWYCSPAPLSAQPMSGVTVYNLYRRQRLVVPYLGSTPFLLGTQIETGASNGRPNTISSSTTGLTAAAWQGIYNGFLSTTFLCDLSLRREDAGGDFFLLPNSLADLTRRENRFWRHRTTTPFTVDPFPHALQTSVCPAFDGTTREGEDLMLTNVLAFDVRVFDPEAPLHAVNGITVTPGDPGYPVAPTSVVATVADLPTSALVGEMHRVSSTGRFYVRLASGNWQLLPLGAYVDLGWGIPAPTSFSAPPATPFPMTVINAFPNGFTPFQGFGMCVSNSPLNLTMPILTYDTWSTHYESNGINEDNDTEDINGNGSLDAGEDVNGNGVIDPLIDEGTDGRDQPTIDTNNDGRADLADGIPDDPAERETSPPYPVPLRGIEIRVRCIEPTTREIRQITIRHAFDQS